MGKGGEHNGQRLARARWRRRWTQERLARESGFSLATVRAVEQGRRSLDNMGQLLTFARALEVPVTDLTGQPYAADSPEQDAGQGAVAGIRRELLLAEREPRVSDTQAAAASIPALRGRVEDMCGRHRSAVLASMGHDLPDLLHDLRVASHVVPAAQRAAAGEFIRVGELSEAAAIIEDGLRALRPLAREDATAAALTGAYELKAALTAARAGDAPAMRERWERAQAIGEQIGRDLNEPLAFGPSNVAIWSVALPVEMLDGAAAVRRAVITGPALDALIPAATIAKGRYSRERLSRHWIDVGRAYHYRADGDRALDSILKAERIAPQKTRINPAAREVVSHLLRARRKNQLVELALRMGVA